jgi:hypothetical protein
LDIIFVFLQCNFNFGDFLGDFWEIFCEIFKGKKGKLFVFRVLLPIDTAVSVMAMNGYVYSNFQEFKDSMLVVWKIIFWGKVNPLPIYPSLDFPLPVPNDPIPVPPDWLPHFF